MADNKLKRYTEINGYNADIFIEKINAIESIWDKEMNNLLNISIDFKDVKNTVINCMKSSLK